MFRKKRVVFLLLIILFLGMSLRLYNLGKENLWTDEAHTLNVLKASLSSLSRNVGELEFAPPFYYFIMKVWTNIFGTSEFAIRFPSLVFGVISIFVLFHVCKSFFSDKIALYSALLFSLSMLNVIFSQEARLYTLSLLFILLSTYLLEKLISENKIKYYALFTISTMISIYVNYVGLIMLFIQSSYMFFYAREKFNKFLKYSLLPSGLLFILLVPTLINQLITAYPNWELKFLSLGIPVFISKFALLWVILIFVLFMALFFKIFKSSKTLTVLKKMCSFKWAFFIVFVYVLLYAWFFEIISHPVFFIRYYFFFFLPLFYVFVSYVAAKFSKNHGGLLIMILVLLNTLALYNYYAEPQKPQWREAVLFIEGFDINNEVLLFDRGAGANRIIYDYYSIDSVDKIDVATIPYRMSNSDLSSKLEKYGFGWLVLSKNKDDSYLEFMDKNHELVIEKEFYGVSAYLFELSK